MIQASLAAFGAFRWLATTTTRKCSPAHGPLPFLRGTCILRVASNESCFRSSKSCYFNTVAHVTCESRLGWTWIDESEPIDPKTDHYPHFQSEKDRQRDKFFRKESIKIDGSIFCESMKHPLDRVLSQLAKRESNIRRGQGMVSDSRHRTEEEDSKINVKNAWGDEIPIMLNWAAEYVREPERDPRQLRGVPRHVWSGLGTYSHDIHGCMDTSTYNIPKGSAQLHQLSTWDGPWEHRWFSQWNHQVTEDFPFSPLIDDIPMILPPAFWKDKPPQMRFETVQFNIAECYWRYASTQAPTNKDESVQWYHPEEEQHLRIFPQLDGWVVCYPLPQRRGQNLWGVSIIQYLYVSIYGYDCDYI